jgi:hypothetical protein
MLKDSPRAIPPPPGRLPQPELGDEDLGRTRRDREFVGNRGGRDDLTGQHIIEERRQAGSGAAAIELAGGQGAGEQGAGRRPAVVILEADLARSRDRLELDGDPRRRVARPAASRGMASSPSWRQGRRPRLLPRSRRRDAAINRPSQGTCCCGAIASQASAAIAVTSVGSRPRVWSTTARQAWSSSSPSQSKS